MSNQKKGFTDEELKMMAEMESLIAEMNQHPEVMNEPLPENLHKELWRDIREYKEEQAEAVSQKPEPEVTRLTDEEKELIQLGKIYKRKKKNKKFYVLIAAIIGAMTFGITSMGGPEKVFERFGFGISNRDQEQINSKDSVDAIETVSEEEIYQQIEDEYGFWPVRLDYLPEGMEFLEASDGEDLQSTQLIYGKDNEVNINYLIRPNYRESSIGKDVEDKHIEEYNLVVNDVNICVNQYLFENASEERWTAEFLYDDVQYFIRGIDLTKQEFEEILKNLNFL